MHGLHRKRSPTTCAGLGRGPRMGRVCERVRRVRGRVSLLISSLTNTKRALASCVGREIRRVSRVRRLGLRGLSILTRGRTAPRRVRGMTSGVDL